MNPKPLPHHGGQLHAIAERFGLAVADLIDFSANINPDGPPASAIAALESGIRNLDTMTQYPDLEERRLKRALAHYAGTLPTRVLVSNGFVPLLEATVRALRLRSCLLPVPAFVEYRRVLERNGVAISPVVLRPEEDFRYDVDALLSGDHDAILLANPQNPSGVLCDKNALLDLVTRAAERSTYILLDEAFIDYAGDHSMTLEIGTFPNLIVFRSLTKCFGVPGLRAAYAIAQETLLPKIEAFLSPWSITNLASKALIAAVEDTAFTAQFPIANERRKTELVQRLTSMGITVYPAAANYLLLRFTAKANTPVLWNELVMKHGLVLRSCENFEGLSDNHLRTSIQNEARNKILTDALSSLLKDKHSPA